MFIETYQSMSTRTLDKSLEFEEQVLNMALGIGGESGEVIDIIKKNIFHKTKLDKDHLTEELGDVLFYLVNLATLYDIDMHDVMVENYFKLKKRYPNGFTPEASIKREDKNGFKTVSD